MHLIIPVRHCFILFLALTTGSTWGQMEQKPHSLTGGLSSERLERYDSFLETKVKDGEIPGVVSVVFRNGELAHRHTYGYRDFENKTPIRENAIFQIMSMTKPIITAAFLMLYEEGHFFLTDPVSNYLPQLKKLKVDRDPAQGIKTGLTQTAN